MGRGLFIGYFLPIQVTLSSQKIKSSSMKFLNQYTDSCLFFILDVNIFQWSVYSREQIQNNLLSEKKKQELCTDTILRVKRISHKHCINYLFSVIDSAFPSITLCYEHWIVEVKSHILK